MHIGERIKEKRKDAKLTQQQLGGEDFTKGYISQIEKGIVEPSMKVLSIISTRLKTPISYFLNEEVNYKGEIQTEYIKGENLYLQQEYEKALEVFSLIVSKSTAADDFYHILSYLYIGKSLHQLGNYQQSIDTMVKVLPQMKDLCLFEAEAEAYNFLGLCYFNLKEYERAILSFNSSLDIIANRNLKMSQLKAKLYLNTGTAYSNMGMFNKAVGLFEKNIDLCQKDYITDTLLDCHVRMGYCNYKLGEYKNAMEHLSKATSINRSLRYEIIDCEIKNILGNLVADEGRAEVGISLLNKSKGIAESINYEFGYNMNIADIVRIMIANNMLKEAEALGLKHLERMKRAESLVPLYKLSGSLGRLYLLRGDIDKGSKALKLAIKGFTENDMRQEIIFYSKLLAEALIEANPEEAKYYFNKSIEVLKTFG